mmetsp:Transcript_71642/g.120041  ORF Transcript_71642/g.120041 Transcript_71642/m.120041 type:complete len:136 (-) Transcript_71642:362-769(-)
MHLTLYEIAGSPLLVWQLLRPPRHHSTSHSGNACNPLAIGSPMATDLSLAEGSKEIAEASQETLLMYGLGSSFREPSVSHRWFVHTPRQTKYFFPISHLDRFDCFCAVPMRLSSAFTALQASQPSVWAGGKFVQR